MWEERLREAAYTAPTGDRLTFHYEDVSREKDLQGTAFNFPDADGTYVQRLGSGGRRYPLRVIFWGENCDLEAKAFEAMLDVPGTGRLDHPMYGPVDVVPFGTIKRRDDLKTAANQVIIEVTFWDTIALIYPASQADPAAAVRAAIAEYNAAIGADFAAGLESGSLSRYAEIKNKLGDLTDRAADALREISDLQGSVAAEINTIQRGINTGIDLLVGQPLALASETVRMLQAPGRILAGAAARLEAYKNLAQRIISGPPSPNLPDFRTNELHAMTAASGSVLTVVNGQFETKVAAVAAAAELLEQFDTVAAWRDAQLRELGELDGGASYQALQKAVALAAGYVVEISFSLKQERRLVLDRPRSIIDLVAQLYGEIDERLDFFINSNELSGSEIIELPAGREVVFYV